KRWKFRDREARMASILLSLRDIRNSILVWDTIYRALGSESRGVQVIESSANLVDCRAAEDVRISCDSLIGFRSLHALLERSAIRDASENAGDVDRIVG